MRVAVVYATLGRAAILAPVLDQLRHQTRPPDRVVVSAVTPEDTVGIEGSPLAPLVLYGPKGLCGQRNRALAAVAGEADIVLFLDDDFIPADDYIAQLCDLFESRPDVVGADGRVIADGATNAGYSFEQGLRFISDDVRPAPATYPRIALYGCNMAIRLAAAGDLTFDERLPFYGWLEDIDYTHRLGGRGALVKSTTMNGVHLATKGGRTSGLRLGYSQIANPVYMWRKGSIPASLALSQTLKNVLSNAARSPKPEAHVDRRGRLRGNLLGFWHLLTARLDPQHVLSMD